MSYEKRIQEFITGNQPCSRKDIIQEFPGITPKTVYMNVRKLLERGEIYESTVGILTTFNDAPPVWRLPVTLREFYNYSDISNAFANGNPQFHTDCVELSRKYGPKLGTLLSDLIIIVAEAYQEDRDEMRKKYTIKEKVDIHELEKSFIHIREFCNTYIEGVIKTK